MESAKTQGISNKDIPNPDYHLVFVHKSKVNGVENQEIIEEIGYYTEEKDLEVTGRYIDKGKGIFYNVTTKLPIQKDSED